MNKLLLLFFINKCFLCFCVPNPIGFCIPESKIVNYIPLKTKDFAHIIPGQINTYIFSEETDYYKDYQSSFFAITQIKGGWDCLRHYEILANGCIPYFLNIELCPPKTMYFLPKNLIIEAMNLPGVSKGKIDHTIFNKTKYYEILNKILEHTRQYLTTKNMAKYLLQNVNYSGNGKILFLARFGEDYQKDLIYIGLKELLKEKIIDYPKNHYLYKSYQGNPRLLYGRGFTYTKILDDDNSRPDDIRKSILNKEFELIIYGSVHRSLYFYDLVKANYDDKNIVYICGEDLHKCPYAGELSNFFLREYDAYSEQQKFSNYLYQLPE